MTYKVLIAGLGKIGLGYDLSSSLPGSIKTHSRAFDRHDKFELLAGVDPNENARNKFNENYKCKSYDDLKTALQDHQPDVVIIATATDFHLEEIETLAQNSSPRAILCEKPLAMRREDCHEILDICSKKKIDIYVNYIRRTDPAVIKIKSMLETGSIEKPIKAVVRYSKGFLHNGSHFFELLNYWLGDRASSQVLNTGRQLPAGDSEPDVHVKFKDGDVTFLSSPDEALSYFSIEMLSPNGRLTYEKGGNEIMWYPLEQNSNADAKHITDQPSPIQSDLLHYQLHVANHLYKALENKEHNLCTGKRAFKIIDQMLSVLEKKKI